MVVLRLNKITLVNELKYMIISVVYIVFYATEAQFVNAFMKNCQKDEV